MENIFTCVEVPLKVCLELYDVLCGTREVCGEISHDTHTRKRDGVPALASPKRVCDFLWEAKNGYLHFVFRNKQRTHAVTIYLFPSGSSCGDPIFVGWVDCVSLVMVLSGVCEEPLARAALTFFLVKPAAKTASKSSVLVASSLRSSTS